jgi:hypothetical protein
MLTSFASHLTAAMNHISATSFMGPLKSSYCQEIENVSVHTKGKLSIVYQIGELFGNAYKRAATAR